MISLKEIDIKIKEKNGIRGVVEIGPLPKWWGYTVATPLRRILLSSIPGHAVTSVKIAGIQHEYSTIKGVKENVVEILLRIKGLSFICHSAKPQILKIEVAGNKTKEKVVTASDIKITQDVEIVDPEAKIATITNAKTKLEIEMTLERGLGYEKAKDDKRSEKGRIPLDAMFSPVTRVAAKVSKVRKGSQMDLDMVTLTIDTDGSIKPSEAFRRASETIRDLFDQILNMSGGEVEPLKDEEPEVIEQEKEKAKEKKTKEKEMDENKAVAMQVPTEELEGLSKKVKNILKKEKIDTVADLMEHDKSSLEDIRGIGDMAIREIKLSLSKMNLELED